MAFHAINHGQAVQLQIDRLKAPIAALRLQAAVSLGALGRKAGPALAALTEALQDRDAQVRKAAALALGAHGAWGKRCRDRPGTGTARRKRRRPLGGSRGLGEPGRGGDRGAAVAATGPGS
jgi:HEAT repeat